MEKINIHCDTVAQFKALRHIQAHFAPFGVADLQLVPNGIRLTDRVGEVADFLYDETAKAVVLHELEEN